MRNGNGLVVQQGITLTQDQCLVAAQFGAMRHALNVTRGDSYGFQGDGWEIDIEGAGAEYAFALWTNRVWTPVAIPPPGKYFQSSAWDGDVEDAEIRFTLRAGGGLILHESDPDDRWFVLVTGKMPHYTIRGCRRGKYGKKPEYWAEPPRMRRACFLVPQDELLPIPDRRNGNGR